jgi:hypothetical protein
VEGFNAVRGMFTRRWLPVQRATQNNYKHLFFLGIFIFRQAVADATELA